MYVVTVGDRYLFFGTDPLKYGCPYLVVAGADLIDTSTDQNEWHLDTDATPHVLTRSRRTPNRFKAFRSELDVPNSWEIMDGVAEVWST